MYVSNIHKETLHNLPAYDGATESKNLVKCNMKTPGSFSIDDCDGSENVPSK